MSEAAPHGDEDSHQEEWPSSPPVEHDEAGRPPEASVGAALGDIEEVESEWEQGGGDWTQVPARVRTCSPGCAFPMALQTIAHSSDTLQEYHAARSVDMLRAEQWRVFCSRRPMAQIFILRWVCALALIFGLVVLLRAPMGFLQFRSVQLLHEASTRQAKMMRFMPLAQRNGEKPRRSAKAGRVEFGPTLGGCRLNQTNVATVSHTLQESTINFPSVVDFDGWYLGSGSEDAQLDPTSYLVHYSTDGAAWELLIDSSMGPQCPCYLDRDRDGARHTPMTATSFPLERRTTVLHAFTDISCLWPYYIIVFATNFFGFALIAAGLLGLRRCHAATVPVLAWGAIISAVLKSTALARLVTLNMPLPFGPVEYSTTSLAIQISVDVLVFPGPLVWTQEHAFEAAFVAALVETIVYVAVFPKSGYTLRGPSLIVLCTIILSIREWRRHRGLQAVQPDRRLFDAAWQRILGEAAASDHVARLQQFVTRHREGFGFEHASVASSRRWVRWQPWQTAGSLGAEAVKLIIEERSPNLTLAIQNVLAAPASLLDLDQLYGQATVMEPIFRKRVQALAAQCRAYVLLAPRNPGAPEEMVLWSAVESDPVARAGVLWAEIKHVDHAVRKSMLNPAGDLPQLPDLVRQRLIFDSIGDVCACLDAIASDADLRIEVVKNGFNEQLDARKNAGYRQVVVLLRVVTEHTKALGISSLNCELQLAHREMSKLVTPEQHARYLTYRSVMGFASFYWFVNQGCWPLPAVGPAPAPAFSGLELRREAPDEQTAAETSGLVQAAHHLTAEGVDTRIAELGAAGPQVQKLLSDRVHEVLRVRCHIPGTLLQSLLIELSQGLKRTHFSMMFFVRPLSLLLAPVGQLLLCMAGGYFMWLFFRSNLFSQHYDVRQVRFRVLETRGGSSQRRAATAALGLTKFALRRHGCEIFSHNISGPPVAPTNLLSHAKAADAHVEMRDGVLLLTLPQYVEMDGWSMTSAVAEGSEAGDPVRFDLSYAQLGASTYSLADCLRGNQWFSDAQIASMSKESWREAVVEQLVRQHGTWCAVSEARRTCEELDDTELLRMCLPASGVREPDWRVVGASACRWGVYDVTCLPKPDEVFPYVTLARGATHVFELSPPWFIALGVIVTYPFIFVFLILSALFGWLATLQLHWAPIFGLSGALLQASRACLSSSFIIPGILEIITALAIVTAPRTASMHINGWDSFYWWPLGVMSLLFGLVIALSEKHIVAFLPLPFLVYFPALFINNWLVIRKFDAPVPYSSVAVLSCWFIFQGLRYSNLRLARQAIAPDAEAYENVWRDIMTNENNHACLRELHEVVIRQATGSRPQQAMRRGGAQRTTTSAKGSGAQMAPRQPPVGTGVPGVAAVSNSQPSFWPAVMEPVSRDPAPWALPFWRACCPGASRQRRTEPSTVAVSSLHTLYMQAYMLEPLFSRKVREIAMAAAGRFLVRGDGAGADKLLVPARAWTGKSDLKSMDRAIEKVTRVYRGHVPSLLDVVRQCIVFERLEDLVSAMRAIEEDEQINVLRIKNRLRDSFDGRQTCGYRDVLLNLRLRNDLTHRLGLDLHVCELQLIMKQFMLLRSEEGHKRYVEFRDKRGE